jgi:hypothetical protein
MDAKRDLATIGDEDFFKQLKPPLIR